MAEFKSATSEFKETWQKGSILRQPAFDLDAIEAEPVARVESISAPETPETDAPAIKSIDPATFDPKLLTEPSNVEASETSKETTVPDHQKDKQNWL